MTRQIDTGGELLATLKPANLHHWRELAVTAKLSNPLVRSVGILAVERPCLSRYWVLILPSPLLMNLKPLSRRFGISWLQ